MSTSTEKRKRRRRVAFVRDAVCPFNIGRRERHVCEITCCAGVKYVVTGAITSVLSGAP